MTILTEGSMRLEEMRSRLEQWFGQGPVSSGIRVLAVEGASAANGYSNETYRVTTEQAGKTERLILRLPPSQQCFFPDYDLGRQYAFLDGLRDAPGVPMAACRYLELNPTALGRPFFLVEYEPGQVAADEPPYLESGWVVDASDAERATLWRSSVDALAALSNVRWSGKQLAAVDWADRSRSRGEQHLDLFERWIAWGERNVPCPERSMIAELRRWLRANLPTDEQPGIIWGDARQGNIIYRDFRPVALLDWELAVIGDPEVDLAYMHVMRRHHFNQFAVTGSPMPHLGGLPSDEEAIEHYNKRAARPVRNYRYYWLMNAYKIYALIVCFSELLRSVGAVDEGGVEDIRRMPTLSDDMELLLGDESHSGFFDLPDQALTASTEPREKLEAATLKGHP